MRIGLLMPTQQCSVLNTQSYFYKPDLKLKFIDAGAKDLTFSIKQNLDKLISKKSDTIFDDISNPGVSADASKDVNQALNAYAGYTQGKPIDFHTVMDVKNPNSYVPCSKTYNLSSSDVKNTQSDILDLYGTSQRNNNSAAEIKLENVEISEGFESPSVECMLFPSLTFPLQELNFRNINEQCNFKFAHTLFKDFQLAIESRNFKLKLKLFLNFTLD